MRWSIGGWVENICFRREPNGLAIIRCELLTNFWSFEAKGACEIPDSSLRSALARAKGSLVSLAPSSSASYSRVRLTAIWITEAAKGASNDKAISALGFTLRLSLFPPPPKNIKNWAMDVMTPAMAAATDEVRMSRLYTCISSWPSTPRNSRSFSSCKIPSVQHTAEFWGLRPVAKALGEDVGEMYRRGIGC